MTKPPGLKKTRVAQRKLHAVVAAKKPDKVAGNWLQRMIDALIRKVMGRG
jgi:hypothetical protein